MKNFIRTAALVVAVSTIGMHTSNAQSATSMKKPEPKTVQVGGEAMFPLKNIVQNAVNSKAHTTLVAAVKAAGLVDVLQGTGPFTVFAPVNDAFENLPEGTVETLLKPENKATLTKVLTYHVVGGKYDFNAIAALIKKGKGKAELPTVSGGKLWFKMNGMHNIIVWDENGASANINTYDVYQSNGVIHSIDAVLLPKM
ncbi:MAG: fasciclin domain-containing protein [Saprospiraceae bacterium]|nr:fasciclin domain-containing protein [Saprospiraceae bacterium]